MPTISCKLLCSLMLLSILSPAAGAGQEATPPSSSSSAAQESAAPKPQDPTVEELKRRVDVLAAELEELRSADTPQRTEMTEDQRRTLGLGPAASSVYERKSGVSFAGYGEMLFEREAGTDQSGTDHGASSSIDFLRAVLYSGYRFNDRFLFNSEVEFEHGGEEVGIEFAYLEYAVKPTFAIRGGMLLMPLGLVNEFHEPTVFIGARRPEVERRIIPSTWHENGAGVVGSAGQVSYRAYVLNGFNASGFSASGLREGRQGGVEAVANDWAFAGRLDYNAVPGAFAGIGLYQGNSGQREIDNANVPTTIVDVHGQAQIRGFDVRGVFAHAALGDVVELNQALGLEGVDGVGKTLTGGYASIAYNLLSQSASTIGLSPYYRFEQINTQASVAPGFAADPARNERWHTLGLEVKPIRNIVVKVDYQWITNKARTGRDLFNVALGYAF